MTGDFVTPVMRRTPAEDLRVGDRVRAVEHGPIGTVVTVGRRWTTVQYSHRVRFGPSETRLPYEHGKDTLIALDAS
jgi:hypothetical protein